MKKTFWKKSLTMPKKTERGDPLGFSNIHSVAKQQKIEGGPFGLARYGMLRGKTGKTFLVQFARPNGAIIFCRTFVELFWSVQVVLKINTDEKP